ncbi:hypothetical protein P12x_001659 [Tundrisphaera lichenicola]|uniref:hypothetical protein n=1 Tax=Tundrisphaera lichenicola TaxID=2029860 RepID=UPI003EB95E50
MPSHAKAWAEASAPPQQQVSLPPEGSETSVASTSPLGLSKFFPGLRRNSTVVPKVEPSSRTSWFAFNRRPKPTQFYMTDARTSLGQGSSVAAGATMLPVAIQVPSEKASDAAVTPARVEQDVPASDLAPPAPFVEMDKMANPAPVAPAGQQLASSELDRPSSTGENAPIPPSAELPAPESGVIVVNRMPTVPEVDPIDESRPSISKPIGSPVEVKLTKDDVRKSDDQARQAIPPIVDPASALEETEPTILAAFLHKIGVKHHTSPHVHTPMALASPQSAPSPQAKPVIQVVAKHKHKPIAKAKVTPTSQVQPTAQAPAHTCVCDNCGAKIGKRPCILKRMKSKLFHGNAEETN